MHRSIALLYMQLHPQADSYCGFSVRANGIEPSLSTSAADSNGQRTTLRQDQGLHTMQKPQTVTLHRLSAAASGSRATERSFRPVTQGREEPGVQMHPRCGNLPQRQHRVGHLRMGMLGAAARQLVGIRSILLIGFSRPKMLLTTEYAA